MKMHFKIPLVIVLTALATFVITSYFSVKHTRAAYVAATNDMEAFNEFHRIQSWDRLEQLLVKGCNKEALEYVRMEQSLGLNDLQWDLKDGAKLDQKVQEETPSILNRAKSFVSKGRYDIPTCN